MIGTNMVKNLQSSGDEIRENLLTGHKFTNLLKSASQGENFLLFSLLDHRKMAFPHLKGKLTLPEKTSKWN